MFHTESLGGPALKWLKGALWIRAILSIVLGILILVWPDKTLEVVAVLFGLYFFIVGIVRIVVGLAGRTLSPGVRILDVVLGLLLVVAGVFAIKNPLATLVALGIIVGISWIIEGVIAVSETANDSSKWFGTVLGVLSAVAGVIILFAPLDSLVILTIIGGITLLVTGVFQVITAITLGKGTKAAL